MDRNVNCDWKKRLIIRHTVHYACKNFNVFVIMLEARFHAWMHTTTRYVLCHTFDCTSSELPMQCLQNLKADALCLKPPKLELAGLSADICASKCTSFPIDNQWNTLYYRVSHCYYYFNHYALTDSSLRMSSTIGSSILSMPNLATDEYLAKSRSWMLFIFDLKRGFTLPNR